MSDIIGIGSSAWKSLITAARLNLSAACMSTRSDDPDGQSLVKNLEASGVDTSDLLVKTGCASGDVPEPHPSEIDLAKIKDAKVLYLDGSFFDAAIHAARYAHLCGVRICLNTADPYDGIERLLPFVNDLIVTESFALTISGCGDLSEAAETLMAQYRPNLVVVLKDEGGALLAQYGQPVLSCPSSGRTDREAFGGTFAAFALLETTDALTRTRRALAAAAQ